MGQVSHHLGVSLTSSRHVQLLGHDAEANRHNAPLGEAKKRDKIKKKLRGLVCAMRNISIAHFFGLSRSTLAVV
jgi:hypothetical protein